MKIQDPGLYRAAASELQRAQQTERVAPAELRRAGEAQAAQQTDTVQLSRLADRLLELARTESSERAARVEKLAAELSAGRYRVDAVALSRRLIGDALEGP